PPPVPDLPKSPTSDVHLTKSKTAGAPVSRRVDDGHPSSDENSNAPKSKGASKPSTRRSNLLSRRASRPLSALIRGSGPGSADDSPITADERLASVHENHSRGRSRPADQHSE